MANIVRALAITLLGAAAFAADHEDIPSPEDWYKNDYAPLYGDKPGDSSKIGSSNNNLKRDKL